MRRFFTFYCFTLVCVTALLVGMSSCARRVTPTDARATYGAQMFHQQLTAQAEAQP